MKKIESKFDETNEDSIQLMAVYDKVTGSSINVGVGEEMSIGDLTEGIAQIAMSALVESLRLRGLRENELEFVIAMSGKIGGAYRSMIDHEQWMDAYGRKAGQ